MLDRIKRHPISHVGGILLMLGGGAIVATFVYHLYTSAETILTIKQFMALGPGVILLGGLLWSEWGNVVDVFFRTAEKFAPDA